MGCRWALSRSSYSRGTDFKICRKRKLAALQGGNRPPWSRAHDSRYYRLAFHQHQSLAGDLCDRLRPDDFDYLDATAQARRLGRGIRWRGDGPSVWRTHDQCPATWHGLSGFDVFHSQPDLGRLTRPKEQDVEPDHPTGTGRQGGSGETGREACGKDRP